MGVCYNLKRAIRIQIQAPILTVREIRAIVFRRRGGAADEAGRAAIYGGVPVSTGIWRRDQRADAPVIRKTGKL